MDARLNKMPLPKNSPSAKSEIICQLRNPNLNCTVFSLESNRYKFIVYHVDPNDIGRRYECEFSNLTQIPIIPKKGSPTKLLQGQ